ncbi:MAG TPA: hypothetical protein VID50_05835 [Candidatus Eisenbacteria bacterium]
MSRNQTAALLLIFAATLALLPACARRAERLVGNERLARGAGGLGLPERDTTAVDRDTDVPGLGRDTGTFLLAGKAPALEAAVYFRVGAWKLPDTTDATLSILSIALHATSLAIHIPRDGLPSHPAVSIVLARAASAWDSSSVTWPGPARGALLGQASEDFTGADLIVPVSFPAPVDTLKAWARDPTSVPGFTLYSPSDVPGGIAAYQAGTIRFRVIYDHTVSGISRTDTLDTAATEDLYLYTPVGGTPSGTEPSLALGGFEERGLVVRAPSPVFPPGASINEAAFLLRVDAATDSLPYSSEGATVDIEVRTVGADWVEGGAALQALMASAAPVAVLRGFAYRGPQDSLIAIHLPGAAIRAWADNPAANYGLLLTAAGGNLVPPLYIRSRESGYGPELRAAYTTPPSGRF